MRLPDWIEVKPVCINEFNELECIMKIKYVPFREVLRLTKFMPIYNWIKINRLLRRGNNDSKLF